MVSGKCKSSNSQENARGLIQIMESKQSVVHIHRKVLKKQQQ